MPPPCTVEEFYAFDASLLRLQSVSLLLRHRRGDLVARAVPPAGTEPPKDPSRTSFTWRAALRLEDRAGRAPAELASDSWDDDLRSVFRELTGHEGWPRHPTKA